MTSRRGHGGRGPRLAAARAVVVAEMAEVDRVEHIRRAAAAAVLRIGGVRHACQRERVVLDAEVEHRRVALTAEVGDRWIVGVEHERRVAGRSGVHGRVPAIGDRLELAVAIELVAEQVAEQDRARVQLGGERVEPQLVDLEQAELARDAPARAGGGEQRGGDPSGHVRPGLVVHRATRRPARGSRRGSPSSWSCRSSPTRARCPAAGAPRARRSRRGRGA